LSNIGATLRGNLNVIQNQLNQWLEERIAYMKHLGHDPALVDLTRSLLEVKPQKRALLASDALKAANRKSNGMPSHTEITVASRSTAPGSGTAILT
jgi:hypothetical protein